MAKLQLTFHDVSFYKNLTDKDTSSENIVISTDKDTFTGLGITNVSKEKAFY